MVWNCTARAKPKVCRGWLPSQSMLKLSKSLYKLGSIPTVRPEEARQRESVHVRRGKKGYNSWQHSSRLPDQSRQESLSHKNHRNSHSPDEQKENRTATRVEREVCVGPTFPCESLVLGVQGIERDISKAWVNLCIWAKAENPQTSSINSHHCLRKAVLKQNLRS